MFAQLQGFSSATRLPTVTNPHKHRCLSLVENLISSYRIHSCGQVLVYTHFTSVLEHLILILKGKKYISPLHRNVCRDQYAHVFSFPITVVVIFLFLLISNIGNTLCISKLHLFGKLQVLIKS